MIHVVAALLRIVISLLCALWAPFAMAQNVNLQGNQLTTNIGGNTITLRGAVKATKNKSTLTTDALIFDKKNKDIKALGDVRYNFDNSLFLSAKYLLLKDNGDVYARQAEYTTCKALKGRQCGWLASAAIVRRNTVAKTVTFEDARFYIGGIPVYYWPYLVLPDISAKKMDGWLIPKWGARNTLGVFFSNTYYKSLSDTENILLTPTYTTGAGYTLALKYLSETDSHHLLKVNASLTKTKGTSVPYLGHMFVNYQSLDKDRWKTNLALSTISQKNYFKKYHYLGEYKKSYLLSTAFREKTYKNAFFKVQASRYQDIRTGEKDDTAIVLPQIVSEVQKTPDKHGGTFSYSTFLRDYQKKNSSSRKFSSEIAYTIPKKIASGGVVRSSLFLRGDITQYNYTTPITINDKKYTSGAAWQLISSAQLVGSFPVLITKKHTKAILEPLVGLFLHGPTKNLPYLPNYYSYAYEQDETSLFAHNRYGGLDKIDNNNRIAYGLHLKTWLDSKLYFQGFLGQSLTLEQRGNHSDYIGSVDLNMKNYVLSANFELGGDLSIKKLEGSGKLYYGKFGIQAIYTRLNMQNSLMSQLNTNVSYSINKFWKLEIQNINNIIPHVDMRNLNQSVIVTYAAPSNCMKVQLAYTKDFSINSISPTRSVYLNFSFDNTKIERAAKDL